MVNIAVTGHRNLQDNTEKYKKRNSHGGLSVMAISEKEII
jgi:hypothetical protein